MRSIVLSACLSALLGACVSVRVGNGFQAPFPAVSAQTTPPIRSAVKGETKLKTVVPGSLLANNTLLTIYGRALGVAPILGRLGQYKDFDSMAQDVDQWVAPIKKENNNKGVLIGIHLIYALAIPCEPRNNDCLLYLEVVDKKIVKNYIELAARRGWVVILDTQLGKSTPAEQVGRMIDKGYLKHDNVHVAIDPEFHLRNGNSTPGVPIGTVEASEINEVQLMLDEYVKKEGLPHKKILIVHQFGDANVNDGVPFMIENKKELKNYGNVELVINADGFGKQPVKVVKYNKITDSAVYPFIRYRGIKIFYPNKWEKAGHFDKPPLSVPQVFGNQKIQGKLKVQSKPDVIIIA